MSYWTGLEWAAAALVLCSVIGYRYKHLSGPVLQIIAAFPYTAWAIHNSAFAIAGLNVVFGLIGVWALAAWVREGRPA